MWWYDWILLSDNSGTILIWNWILSWRWNCWWFHILFFLGIVLSILTLAPIPDKRETLVGILDANNISCGANGSNWLIIVDILVKFCVLVDSVVALSIQALGSKNDPFIFYIITWCYWIFWCLFIIQMFSWLIY